MTDKARAVRLADGSHAITGDKIVISDREHDMMENIVRLVLARLPDAPAGSRGISLFLVPKLLPQDGGPGKHDGLHCSGIEPKMSIHGSATCLLRFEGAEGSLIAEPHRGLVAHCTGYG